MTTQIIYLVLSFVLTAILGKIIIPILKKLKVGQNERACGPRAHLKKQGTPTMGGIMMMISIIVLAGKGHEPYQEINGEKLPYDERIIVKEIIG